MTRAQQNGLGSGSLAAARHGRLQSRESVDFAICGGRSPAMGRGMTHLLRLAPLPDFLLAPLPDFLLAPLRAAHACHDGTGDLEAALEIVAVFGTHCSGLTLQG